MHCHKTTVAEKKAKLGKTHFFYFREKVLLLLFMTSFCIFLPEENDCVPQRGGTSGPLYHPNASQKALCLKEINYFSSMSNLLLVFSLSFFLFLFLTKPTFVSNPIPFPYYFDNEKDKIHKFQSHYCTEGHVDLRLGQTRYYHCINNSFQGYCRM